MKQIKVFCEEAIQRFKTDKKYAIISIQDPDYDWVPLKEPENCLGILKLKFWDFDRKTRQEKYDKYLFSSKEAKQIIDFVEHLKDDIDILCVNCVAGISRSAGTASSLNKIYLGTDEYYFKHYCPNMLIYRTILNAYYEN